MTKKFQITLADIAKKVNVSKVTVSKALRGHPDISSTTKEKIKQVARELGYIPNYMARNLSSNSSRTIGVIVPKIAHSFFSNVIEAIYDSAFEQKYEIILTVSQENAERELQHIRSLLSMRVDGLIISVSQQTKDDAIFQKIKKWGIPLTFMDRVINIQGFNSVVADDQGGAFSAVEQAIKVGYRKIAHFAGYTHINIGKERLLGYESAMKKYGLTVRPEWIVHGGFSEEDGTKGFKRIYESGNLPEVIFAVTFPVALGVYRAAQHYGLTIPKDIDIISFGNSGGLNQFLSPPMSYVEQPTKELGRKALELTIENVKQKNKSLPRTITLPTRLVLCKTCVNKVIA
jgi:LacI family transcriptional regulator